MYQIQPMKGRQVLICFWKSRVAPLTLFWSRVYGVPKGSPLQNLLVLPIESRILLSFFQFFFLVVLNNVTFNVTARILIISPPLFSNCF
jgi:hypothetical protein